MSGVRDIRRQAVSLDETMVSSAPIDGTETLSVFTPLRPGVSLSSWAEEHRTEVEDQLLVDGAVLFRGFELDSPAVFEAAAGALAPAGLHGDYGDLPREASDGNVFLSTPYPDDLQIHFHNESSHLSTWPLRIFFNCAIAAHDGGETPILDCRRIYSELDRSLIDEFESKGLTYIRNFTPGIDVAWQSFFGTSDRLEVEQRCHRTNARCEWIGDDALRVHQDAAAVRDHPVTGERVLFNQVLLHHPAAVPGATRDALLEIYEPDALPRNVTFGDGTAIADEAINYLVDEYEARSVRFTWEVGDMLMLDNMLVSHARAPFVGPRKILVAMATIVNG
ncbi:MAG: TauD/TfdA family dioxygenase [Acidimicrobiales bacterium]|jgi:alpha-ketoglutarate-dependent taurine dioxygenase